MSSTRDQWIDLFHAGLVLTAQREGTPIPSREDVATQLAITEATPAPPPRPSGPSVGSQKAAHRKRLEQLAEPATGDEHRAARDERPPPRMRWRPIAAMGRRSRERLILAVARSAPRFSPHDWSARAWGSVRAVFDGISGRRVELASLELPRSFRARVYAACLTEQRGRGDDRDGIDFAHITTRGIIASAIVLLRESVETRKRGFGRVLAGVSQAMFASLFRNPQTGRGYSVGTLFATEIHRDKERAGWVRALERAGAVEIIQPPGDVAPKEHVGPSGFALAQYWITERATIGAPRLPQIAILAAAGYVWSPGTSSTPARFELVPRGPP